MKTIIVMIAIAILVEFGHTQNLPKPGECGIFAIKPKATSRIVNGEAVIPHSRPYQLLLMGFLPDGKPDYYCGASLVKPTHVLTAAHCVKGKDAKNLRIYVATHNFDLSQFTLATGFPVRQFIIHESYNDKTLANDVAVIRLQLPVEVDGIKVGLICLADQSTPACAKNHPVVASGWGSMTGNPNRTSASRPTELQQVALWCEDSTNADCKRLTYLLGIFQEKSKMCAYAPNKGVCFGDSGGPLVRERTLTDGRKYLEQVGIMSGTVDCSFTKPQPDIYCDVRNFHPWILKQINATP